MEGFMVRNVKVTAIVGSYRKRGIVDKAVDELLASAKEAGAEVSKIYLIDRHIEFCTNCRACMQQAGAQRGMCVLSDDMEAMLRTIDDSDGLVLASPMNFGTVTAVMKRFIERLGCFAYWPWGMPAPKLRNVAVRKRAVVIASSAAPALLARIMTQIVSLLKKSSKVLGAKPVGVLLVGLAAQEAEQELSEASRKRARLLGKKLVVQSRIAHVAAE